MKTPEEYQPQDFAQVFHELLPFKHEHKKDKSAIQRNSLSLTNKFVHEGEFAEEQNIIMDAADAVKALYKPTAEPSIFPQAFLRETETEAKES